MVLSVGGCGVGVRVRWAMAMGGVESGCERVLGGGWGSASASASASEMGDGVGWCLVVGDDSD